MRPVLAVAWHEARRSLAVADRRILAAALLMVVLLAAAWPLARERGTDIQAGLYPVAVEPDSPFAAAVAADGRLRVVAGGLGDLEARRIALVVDDGIHATDHPRSQAALQALREATAAWLETAMAGEPDRAAAYPLRLTLVLSQPANPLGAAPPPAAGTPSPTGPALPTPANATVAELAPQEAGTTVEEGLRPRDLEPPFPVRSLLLTFAYLIPMNFVAQLYAGSLLSERTRHRAVPLLSSPLSGGRILLARSLPHVALGTLVWAVAGTAIAAGPAGWLAAAAIVGFVLASAALLGLLARSERELTFLLTGTTTLFSTFLFLPAVFTALPPVAFLSPVSVVAASIDGRAVAWGSLLYAVLPTLLAAAALAALAAALYRDETLHSRRGLAAKAGQALQRLVATRPRLLVAGILLVPFALALELFVLGLVIPLGLWAAFPGFILGAALVEETLKRAASAAHRRAGGQRHRPSAWGTGLLVGSGFFLGEKLALLAALAGFGLLPLGGASLAVLGAGPGLLLLAPLLLHAATATVGALGVGRRWGWMALPSAWLLHAGYNACVAWGVSW